MTQEELNILNIDLCARLPYGVKIKYLPDDRLDGIVLPYLHNGLTVLQKGVISYRAHIKGIRPYLRPMSSMTEEEEKEYSNAHVLDNCDELANIQKYGNKYIQLARTHAHDYLVSHHFDYRGLIEMGLALEAPEGMYE